MEEIAKLLTDKINITQVFKQMDDFIEFIIRYINDSNEVIATISL